MTPRQRDIMKHALGAGKGRPGWRNYFVTGPGSDDYDDCEALVAAGMMTKRSAGPLSGGDPVYRVTDAGQDALEGREAPQQTGAMTYSQRLAYLRERRILLKNLADVRDKATGLGLHENLRAVSGLLHLGVPALESLAPALRQLPIPGTDTTPTRAAT